MLNDGYQELEQRDANDKIAKAGVVSKNSPFATADNRGIYDVIAENFRVLKGELDDAKDTSDVEKIKSDIQTMYDTMKNDTNFGNATAKAQAEEALKQAQSAANSATQAKASADSVNQTATDLEATIADIKDYVDKAEALVESNKTLEQSVSDNVQLSVNKAKAASESEAHAKTSETNAKTSETNSKTSEIHAKTSETNAANSATASSNSASLSRAWAESSSSPDNASDTASATGKTQSSRSWAIDSKNQYNNAKNSANSAADSASAANSSKQDAANSETNAKSYMNTAKDYMQQAQDALKQAQAISSVVDIARQNAEKCLADVEAVKDALSKMITYQGSVDNYSDLPTTAQLGFAYNVKNADKAHEINAGDNVVWNGTSWDNFGSFVDMSLFAELGKDVNFNTVKATAFTGNLNGTASKATSDASGSNIINTYATKAEVKSDVTTLNNTISANDTNVRTDMNSADTAIQKELSDTANSITTYTNRLQRNKTYAVGDIAYSPNLPSYAYLECIQAGTTGTTEPDFTSTTGGK